MVLTFSNKQPCTSTTPLHHTLQHSPPRAFSFLCSPAWVLASSQLDYQYSKDTNEGSHSCLSNE